VTATPVDDASGERIACGVPVVLRSEDFGSVNELLAARASIAGPVLFRVRAGELDAVLGQLHVNDDVCLESDPPRLVEYRRRALAERMAIDPLTGLAERTSFVLSATATLPAALLLVNLDHFKLFNDTHGHLVGDEVLRAAAIRTRAALPATARVARIGGDVFAVAVAEPDEPRRVAEAILTAIRAAPLHADGTVTVSIGLVTRTTEARYDELLRRAEGALYAAKARGRNRVVDHAERERVARARDSDVELDGFEDMTRVLADRVAGVISSRGRRVFQELRDQADLDALTGLASRRYLDRRLPFEIDQRPAACFCSSAVTWATACAPRGSDAPVGRSTRVPSMVTVRGPCAVSARARSPGLPDFTDSASITAGDGASRLWESLGSQSALKLNQG
jgi:diguanylate cyclase (GGDEF)-like protein